VPTEVSPHLTFLVQLFAPRGPLAYYRPLDKDVDRVTKKNVDGIAGFLQLVQEENAQGIIAAGREAMEEGEEPTFTIAEETRREMRREERRKKKEEEFNQAKETCRALLSFLTWSDLISVLQINLLRIPMPPKIPTKRYSLVDWCVTNIFATKDETLD
jgi:hypothetical protein